LILILILHIYKTIKTPAIKHDISQAAIFTICKLGPGLAPELLFWGGAPEGVTVGVMVRTSVATCPEVERTAFFWGDLRLNAMGQYEKQNGAKKLPHK